MFVTSQLSTLEAQPWRTGAHGQEKESKRQNNNNNVIYRVVDGPVRRLGLAEAGVGDVCGGDGDVLAGAGEQQHGAVHDDHVPVPVLTTSPATTLHLQEAAARTRLYSALLRYFCSASEELDINSSVRCIVVRVNRMWRPLVAIRYKSLFFWQCK